MKVTSPPNYLPFQVRINPTSPGSGLSAFASWDNPDVHEALKTLFSIGPHEQIASLEIDSKGITARIDYKPTKHSNQ